MSVSIFASSRTFQVWMYTVSHSMLLLRSPRTDTCPTRIDLLFKPVDFVLLPTVLTGVDVRLHEGGDSIPLIVRERIGRRARAYSLDVGDPRAWVVSSIASWHEDEGDDFGPSYFTLPRMAWD